MMALSDEVQAVGGSTEQELYDKKISLWFEDEKNLKDDLEWQEIESRVVENVGIATGISLISQYSPEI